MLTKSYPDDVPSGGEKEWEFPLAKVFELAPGDCVLELEIGTFLNENEAEVRFEALKFHIDADPK